MVFIRVTKEGDSENALGRAYIVSDKSLLHERATPCLSCLLPKHQDGDSRNTRDFTNGMVVITVSLSFFYMQFMDMMQKCGSEISV